MHRIVNTKLNPWFFLTPLALSGVTTTNCFVTPKVGGDCGSLTEGMIRDGRRRLPLEFWLAGQVQSHRLSG